MKVPGSLTNLPDLMEATYSLVAQVPEGRVTTYGEVAKALGDVVASRFVGAAMSVNQDTVRVPCRRVVQSDGSVGGYTDGGPQRKTKLLKKEGIKIARGKITDFDKVLFKNFITERPLVKLRRRQRRLSMHLNIESCDARISAVGGIDVAYDGDHAFAAMVVFDYDSRAEIERHVVEGNASFPYIPTYLAFRELPVVAPLMEYVGENTVLMYDGNGILHPEGFGIASHLGVAFDVPSIGIAKRLLCGEIFGNPGNSKEILMNGKIVGHALAVNRSVKPVYVSPGNKISSTQAKKITRRFLNHKVPEPTRRAHILAEAARRGTTNI